MLISPRASEVNVRPTASTAQAPLGQIAPFTYVEVDDTEIELKGALLWHKIVASDKPAFIGAWVARGKVSGGELIEDWWLELGATVEPTPCPELPPGNCEATLTLIAEGLDNGMLVYDSQQAIQLNENIRFQLIAIADETEYHLLCQATNLTEIKISLG